MSLFLVNPPSVPRPSSTGRPRSSTYVDQLRCAMSPDQYRTLPLESLALMSILSYARDQGLKVGVVNGLVARHISIEETFEALKSSALLIGSPRLIGFSCIGTFDEAASLAFLCKQRWPEVRTLVGHDLATMNYRRVLEEYSCFDFVCIGDGEVVFAETAVAILNRRETKSIAGLAQRGDEGAIFWNSPEIIDLDQLPRVSRDETRSVMDMGFAPALFTQRGCPFRCSFCATGTVANLLGKQGYRARSIEPVIDEIKLLARDYSVSFLTISDDMFVTPSVRSRERTRELAETLIAAKLDLHFMCDVRLDSIEPQLFALLYRAGLRRVFIGLESGTIEQLRTYNKPYAKTAEQVRRSLQVVRDLGIDIIPGVITFHPTISPEELRATVEVIRASGYREPNVLHNRAIAYSGTPLYELYREAGHLKEGWPVPGWYFHDSGAAEVYRTVRRAADAPGADFASVCAQLLEAVDAWEVGRTERGLTNSAV